MLDATAMNSALFTFGILLLVTASGGSLLAAHPQSAPGVTSLTSKKVKFTVPAAHYVELKRGPIAIIITDNEAVDVPALPKHKAGNNGVASLKHDSTGANLFVPDYSGLNLSTIHDGTGKANKDIFDPRTSPMELRVVDEFTVELYQPPTKLWQLESCGRYHLLEDGTIEYTFECIPRAESFTQKWFSVFWSSFIERASTNSVHLKGREATGQGSSSWIEPVSPWHGVDSSIPPAGPLPETKLTSDFSLLLVMSRSKYVHTEPWYYGVSHDLAYVQMFREKDAVWFAQSPQGGGEINPAWAFYWFVPDWKVGEAYGLVMRTACIPYKNPQQVEEQTRSSREALNPPDAAKAAK